LDFLNCNDVVVVQEQEGLFVDQMQVEEVEGSQIEVVAQGYPQLTGCKHDCDGGKVRSFEGDVCDQLLVQHSAGTLGLIEFEMPFHQKKGAQVPSKFA
jgi:hypothetical protein